MYNNIIGAFRVGGVRELFLLFILFFFVVFRDEWQGLIESLFWYSDARVPSSDVDE